MDFSIYFLLIGKLVPLYTLILIGFIAAKKLEVNRESISKLLLYIVAPVVMFSGAYRAEITWETMMLPFVAFAVCSFMALLFYGVGSWLYGDDSRKHVLAFSAGTGNSGYFGLPLVLALFGEEVFVEAVLVAMGFSIYINTIGYFLTASGAFSGRESMKKVIKLPVMYAFGAGLLLNVAGLSLGHEMEGVLTYFIGTYSVLGMMMVGIGLSGVRLSSFDASFMAMSFLAKFLVWPVIIGVLVFLDAQFTQFFSHEVHQVLLLISVVPHAANTVVVATELGVHVERVALTVFIGTLYALIYIPVFVALFLTTY